MDPTQLDQIPLFAGLTPEERAEVLSCAREVTVESGASLAAEGDMAYELFVIRAGDAEVHKDGEFIRTLGPGDVFGEIALLATGMRTASVTATSPMRLVAIFVQDFKRLERRMPALAKSLRETAAERAARTGL